MSLLRQAHTAVNITSFYCEGAQRSLMVGGDDIA